MIGQPYIRKKGKSFVIERKVDGKTEYIKTLPGVRDILVMLGVEASRYYEEAQQQKTLKASVSEKRLNDLEENKENESETFAQDKLTDSLKKTPTEEELKKLWELTK